MKALSQARLWTQQDSSCHVLMALGMNHSKFRLVTSEGSSPFTCNSVSFGVEGGHSLMESLLLPTQPCGKGAGVLSAARNSNKTTLGNFIVET